MKYIKRLKKILYKLERRTMVLLLMGASLVIVGGVFVFVRAMDGTVSPSEASQDRNSPAGSALQKNTNTPAGTTTAQPGAENTQNNTSPTARNNPAPQPGGGSSSKTLNFSPSSVTFDPGQNYVTVVVSAGGGEWIGSLSVSTTSGVMAYIKPEDNHFSPTWELQLTRLDPGQSGQGYVTLSARSRDNTTYSGKIFIARQVSPYFTVGQGSLTKEYDGDYVTLTAYFTLQPNSSFGNPTVRMNLTSDKSCLVGYSTVITRVVTYSGQNDYSLSCTMYKSSLEQGGFFIRVGITADYVSGGGSLLYTAMP